MVKYHNGLENVKQYYNLSDDELAITKPTINRGELGFDGVGISNGVSHVMGNFNWQTPEVVATHEVKVTKTVERSASIPPIDKHHHYSDDDSDIQTKKRILRRLYCAHNFEQILENLIEQQTDEEEVKANATQSIYEFTLAENTLLSPLGNKAFNKVVAGPFMSHNESEARQHKEELRVLRAYAAKDHFELNIHGKTVKVKLNLLPINTPVNLNGFKQAVKKAGNPWSTFEKHLNKETIYHLGLEVGNYLKMIEDELMMTPEFEKNNFSNSMLNLLSAFTREHKPINDRNFTRLKEELSNEYELYYSFLLQITNTHDLDKNITEDAVNKLDQTTATIKDLEKQLYVHYDGHYRNERKEWTSHKKSAEKRLIEFLSEQITNNSNIDETTLNKYKLVRDIAEIYYAIKDLYYGKHFKKPKHAYHLVQKYAQLCDLINIPILVHCKSGKDRTGSAVDHAEVEDIYKQFKDRYYQFDSGNENYDDLFIKIAKVIDFAGASLENCRLNAPGAKAEQVDNPFSYHKLLHKKLRKLVSLTAKEIYLDSNSIFGYSPSVDYYCLPNAIKTAREELKSLLSQPNSQNDTTTTNMQQAIGAGQTLLSTLAKRSPNKHIYQASDYCTNVLNNPTSLAAALESMGITPYRVTQQAGIKVKKPKPASADLTENSMRLHKFKNIAYTETVNKLEVIYHNKNVSNADKQTLTAIHKMYLDFKAQHPDTTEITIYGSDADLVKKCLSVANVLKINAKIDLKNINDPAEIRAIETLCDECTQIETSLINHVKQNDNQELNRMNNPIKLEQSQNPHNLTV